MTTEMDAARMVFGWANPPKEEGYGAYSAAASVRYGTVRAVNGDGTIDVELDGSGVVVTVHADGLYEVGDRVQIVKDGASYTVSGLAGMVKGLEDAETRVIERIEQEGASIRQDAERDLGEVRDAFHAFKATHALTDEDIRRHVTDTATELASSFEAAIEEAGETYATKVEVSQTIAGLRTEVSEDWSGALGAMSESLGTRIEQNSTAIRAEASERTKATSGALAEAKSYAEQTATSIAQGVEQRVTDAAGRTYATKTALTQTAEGLETEIGKVAQTAEGASGWKTFITQNSYGVNVHGRSSTGAATSVARVGNGSFSILPAGGASRPDAAAIFNLSGRGGSCTIDAKSLNVNGMYGTEVFGVDLTELGMEASSGAVLLDRTLSAGMFACVYYIDRRADAKNMVKFRIRQSNVGSTGSSIAPVNVVLGSSFLEGDGFVTTCEHVTFVMSGSQVYVRRGVPSRLFVPAGGNANLNYDTGTDASNGFIITYVSICA